jgi:predicted nucleotidyltransferase
MANARRLAYIESMRRDDVIARLKETEPVLRGFGVAALYLFGSHARDEASPDSDVDVFIDVAPGAAFGLRPYMGGFETLKQAVGENVDYGTRNGLHPLLRSDIEHGHPDFLNARAVRSHKAGRYSGRKSQAFAA